MTEIAWTGDLDNDCTAKVEGLNLHARNAGDSWWWIIYALEEEAVAAGSQFGGAAVVTTGEEAREAAERALGWYLAGPREKSPHCRS